VSSHRILLLTLILGLLFTPTLDLASAPPVAAARTARAAPQAAPTGDTVRLNEVMPKAATGGFEWVEIWNTAPFYEVFLPSVLRLPTGAGIRSESAGVPTPRTTSAVLERSVDISGWEITDGEGSVYTIPDALPPMRPMAFVRVIFDGQGSSANDYDMRDGLAVLHTPAGATGVFDDATDQAALYTGSTHESSTIRDFVAWGADPGQAADDAIAAGLWLEGQYLEFAASAGFVADWDTDLSLQPDESVGRYDPATLGWAVYRADQLTPGAANPVPQPGFHEPATGGAVDTDDVVVAWSVVAGASGYRFQLAETADFAAPLVDTETPYPDYRHPQALSTGLYYWRVAVKDADGVQGAWTAPATFQAVDLTPIGRATIQAEKTLGITWQIQHKDTFLLDVSEQGDNTRTGDGAWDAPHPDGRRVAEHDNHYCQVASMSMINSYYGGDISQDRLSYYAIREYPDSSRGLDPDRDCSPDPAACRPDVKDDFWAGRNKGLEAMSWMLGYAYDDRSDIDINTYDPPTTTIPFADIKTWIDAGRPLMVIKPGHVMVIDGYRTGAIDQVHLLDPWSAASWKPMTDTGSIQKINWVAVYPAPGTPPAPRSDEASVWTDTDGDGVYDFDEARRFHTDPLEPDTDGDWVPDKDDIEETVYDRFDAHVYTPARADWDGDGDRKELDWDNDNDTAPDGCEDTNYNGIFEPFSGETDNFAIGDYQDCSPQLDILYPLQLEPANAGDPAAPDKLLVEVSTAVPDGWPLSLTRHDFTVEIGSDAATVATIYPSGDSHWLVVQPPAKSAAYYDLTVRLSGNSDTEQDAVYYLADQAKSSVMLLDRSGSMGYDGKLEAAQNAASAFVDVLSDSDEVGVTSFGSSADVEYALSEITNSSVRLNAITAVYALTPTGQTALGLGAQTGYGQLTSNATADNRWSLVLLSDGYENVAPYWGDISAGITDAVVHTVALGDDAERTLLQQIAAQKHGNFFVVDVAPPFTNRAASDATTAASLALPSTLPNRLAEAYIAIGELVQRQQRLWDEIGSAANQEPITINPVVEPGLPEANFILNWDDPLGVIEMSLTDPDGNAVTPNATLSSDTHRQLRVKNPAPGTWTVEINVLKPTAEYHFMLSGKSITTLLAAVGGRSQDHAIGEPIPIYGILSDNAPITGADVQALIAGPAAVSVAEGAAADPTSFVTTVQLYDDGTHGDAEAGDGLYTNEVVAQVAGGYSVKLVAEGTDNDGLPFTRYAQTGFNVRHRAAYIWQDDLDTALDYAGLLERNDWIVDLVRLTEVATTDFGAYSLIVVGPETGEGPDFDDQAAAGALAQWPAPILGLGEGGAALFSDYNLNIGYGDTWFSNNNNVYPVAPSTSYWNHPYDIDTPRETTIRLYPDPLQEMGVHLPDPLKTVTRIAREANDASHYPVVREISGAREFVFWGYDLGPQAMTDDGRALLVNVTHALR
jgi:Mg-chelatase subunit ChlD